MSLTKAPSTVKCSAPNGLARRSVLLIHRDPLLGRAIERALKHTCEVIVVGHALGAVAVLSQGWGIDLILCEVGLPEPIERAFFQALGREFPELVDRVVFLEDAGDGSGGLQRHVASKPAPRVPMPLNVASLRGFVRRSLEHVGVTGHPTRPHR